MANLTIRNLDEKLKAGLRMRAARNGCSMEQEVREILRKAVFSPTLESSFAERMRSRFAPLKLETLPIPKRRGARLPQSSGK